MSCDIIAMFIVLSAFLRFNYRDFDEKMRYYIAHLKSHQEKLPTVCFARVSKSHRVTRVGCKFAMCEV